MSDNTSANETIIRVKVPLPFSLRWVNAYLISGDDGYTMIDPGLHTEDAAKLWEETLASLGIGFGNIERIVLTHHHPDHYGLAGWMQARSGAPVWLSREGKIHAERLWGRDQPLTEQIYLLFRQHGMTPERLGELTEHLTGFVEQVSPQPELSMIEAGLPFRMGDAWYETIETAGHASGHISFYRRETQEMLCGDHVLPHISPNVSFIPGGDGDPLQSFLQGLVKLSDYPVAVAYPGHREPFADFGGRTAELHRHHESRLERMECMLDEPQTAYHVCLAMFGDRLSIHNMRFALAETIAHLIYLHRRGRIDEVERGGAILYNNRKREIGRDGSV